MSGPKLDGAGVAKLKTLDEALLRLQRLHATVEQYAMAVKKNQSTGAFLMPIRRQLPALCEFLKAQFGLVADQVMQVNLAQGRGASEAVRVRVLREGVAQIKQGLEIAIALTKDKHTHVEEKVVE